MCWVYDEVGWDEFGVARKVDKKPYIVGFTGFII